MKPYITKTGLMQYKPRLEELQVAAEEGTTGFCLSCGAEQSGFEPDARKGRCEACGADKVYGAEELILMGLYY